MPHRARPVPRGFASRASAPRWIGPAVALVVAVAGARVGSAQSLEDAELLQRHEVHASVMYGTDSWSEYWEGTLRRSNGNVGTVTTRTIALDAGVGVTDRLTLIGALPYVWTEASQGDALHDLATLTLGHEEHLADVVAGYGTDVDLEVIRAWWSLRSLLGVRWLVEHGYDPFSPGCEVDVLRSRM